MTQKQFRTSVGLNDDVRNKAQQLATKLDRSISSLIRVLIEKAYSKEFSKEIDIAKP